jgi:hypothetical protein
VLGLAPAMHSRGSRLSDALKESARGSVSRRARLVRSALVISECRWLSCCWWARADDPHSAASGRRRSRFRSRSVLTARVSIPAARPINRRTVPANGRVARRCSIASERCRVSPTRASSRIRRSPGWTPRCSTRPRDKA